MIAAAEKIGLSKSWVKLLKNLPGYDPFTTAGDCTFDLEAARQAIDFFPDYLKHIKGPKAGQPFKLARWEKAIIANLFGWKRPDGTRRYREAFIFVARKNGKTSMAAGIIIYVLTSDGEPGAEIYSSANDRDQARLVFKTVKGMILASEQVQKYCKIYQNSITAYDPDNGIESGSFYTAISSEANTKHGYNTHLVVNDELHGRKDRELIDVLETSTAARAQPLIVHITTSDFDRPSICNEKYDYARNVRDGIFEDESFLPAIFEASPDDNWKKPAAWRKANPNLGVSIPRSYIEAKCAKAIREVGFQNTFRRLHLNIKTEQETRWIALEDWDKCAGEVIEKDLIGKECFTGFDLSSNTDITAHVLLFPCKNGAYKVLPRFWIPADNAVKREERDRVPYIAWAKQGYIKLTPGNVVDFDIVKKDFEADCEKFDIRETAFDRWNFEALRQAFIHDGIEEEQFVSFGQGFASMSAPSSMLEKLILGRRLAHAGNPILRWMASNVSAEIDAAGNIKPSKKKSRERIDGIVALIEAIGRAIVAREPETSVYDTRGLTRV